MHEKLQEAFAPRAILVRLDTGEYDAEVSMQELTALAETCIGIGKLKSK